PCGRPRPEDPAQPSSELRNSGQPMSAGRLFSSAQVTPTACLAKTCEPSIPGPVNRQPFNGSTKRKPNPLTACSGTAIAVQCSPPSLVLCSSSGSPTATKPVLRSTNCRFAPERSDFRPSNRFSQCFAPSTVFRTAYAPTSRSGPGETTMAQPRAALRNVYWTQPPCSRAGGLGIEAVFDAARSTTQGRK